MSFFGAISRGFASVLRFQGRDSRPAFWFYLLAIVALTVIAGFASVFPMFVSTFSRMQAFAATHPDQATVEKGAGHYSVEIHGYHPELMPDFSGFIVVEAVSVIVLVALLAAAVARRLHDSGRSGWWGMMPLPFLAIGLAAFLVLFLRIGSGHARPDFALVGFLFVNNLVYLGTLVGLIVMLALPTQPQPNRYGRPPSH